MKEKFIDRELSWLDFNTRVLFQACLKKGVPVIEQLKFLGITQSNLDEFISVRFGDVYNKYITKYELPDDIGNTNYKKKYNELLDKIIKFKQYQGIVYNKCLNKLKSENILITSFDKLSNNEKRKANKYFLKNIMGILTPILFSNRKEMPLFKNDEINIFVQLEDRDKRFAFVQIPSSVDRLIKIDDKYIYIEDLIIANIKSLFQNVNIKDIGLFKINRQYLDIAIESDNKRSIVDFIRESLSKRDRGKIILIDAYQSSKRLQKSLTKIFNLPKKHMINSDSRIDLGFFVNKPIKGNLQEFENTKSLYPTDLVKTKSLLEYIKRNDLVLNHPTDSYEVILDFLKEAASDPKVLSIKQTLYRVSSVDSPIVKALCRAAQNGKSVTVMLELLARFDESQNLKLIDKLHSSGVNIVYTLEGVKTHCKMIIVTKKNKKGLDQYGYVATGNFNEKTARIYTDISLFTSNRKICKDLNDVFNIITGYSNPKKLKKVSISPFGLKKKLIKLINNEIESVEKGHEGKIKIKVNAVCDIPIMEALLKAADKGVKIELICRGINSLPYHPNIEIHSVIGKYLEHSRIYQFYANGKNKTFISSADLLTRNLDKRIELLVPIKDKSCKKKVNKIFKDVWHDKYNTFIYTKKGYVYLGGN